jgi:hypothetical protein
MRTKTSYAAAVAATVAAVVFSAAFQPAEASIIVIDDFTQAQTSTASGVGNPVSDTDDQAGSFGVFDSRETNGAYGQLETRGTRTVLASSNGTGTGTLTLTNNGAGTGVTEPDFGLNGAFASLGYTVDSAVNLTGQQYSGFWIETAATSSSPGGAFKGFLYVSTLGGSQDVLYDLPGMWAPNTSTEILFSTLQAINPALDFTAVDGLFVGIRNTDTLAGSQSYTATADFTLIAAVPEPTQMVSVGAVGAMFGAWRLRKHRRDRMTAGEATAG